MLAPKRGGALLASRIGGTDLLRPAPEDSCDPLTMAGFPLVPYANRIGHGCFRFDGADYPLPRNFGDHPHGIHRVGWQAAWTLENRAADGALLVHHHAADAAWPWAYRAEQHVRLLPDAITIELSVTNIDDVAMPPGPGFHPYFMADRCDTEIGPIRRTIEVRPGSAPSLQRPSLSADASRSGSKSGVHDQSPEAAKRNVVPASAMK